MRSAFNSTSINHFCAALLKSSCVRVNVLQGARLETPLVFYCVTFICSSSSSRQGGRNADGIVLEITATRNRATSEHSHSQQTWSRGHELSNRGGLVLERRLFRSFPLRFWAFERKVDRLEEARAGGQASQGKQKSLNSPRALVLQACRRKKDPLSIDRRSTRRFGRSPCSIRTCLLWAPVHTDLFGKYFSVVSMAERCVPFILTGPHCVSKLANKIKVRGLLCKRQF